MPKGPCIICGRENYPLSMGGESICPACDCGHVDHTWHNARIESLESDLAAEREKVRKLRGAATFARRGCSFNSMFAECEVLDEALSETAPKEEGHE